MDTNQVSDLIKALTLKHKAFIGTFSRDHMPDPGTQRPFAFVVNTESCKGPGEHWNAILLLPGGESEFFNSLGFPPLHDQEQEYMRRHSDYVTFCGVTLQYPLSDRCGLFCVDYLSSRLKGEPFSRFVARYLNRGLQENELTLDKRILSYHTSPRELQKIKSEWRS